MSRETREEIDGYEGLDIQRGGDGRYVTQLKEKNRCFLTLSQEIEESLCFLSREKLVSISRIKKKSKKKKGRKKKKVEMIS